VAIAGSSRRRRIVSTPSAIALLWEGTRRSAQALVLSEESRTTPPAVRSGFIRTPPEILTIVGLPVNPAAILLRKHELLLAARVLLGQHGFSLRMLRVPQVRSLA
jgi:hypothetical protein